jgi:hypothetical protein
MSDRLKAIASDVVNVSDVIGAASPGVGGSSSGAGRDPRDEVKMKQESGY